MGAGQQDARHGGGHLQRRIGGLRYHVRYHRRYPASTRVTAPILTRAADRIARAWREARESNPGLTQREFAATAFPAEIKRGNRTIYRSVETRARDLRRILSGKDTRARVRPVEVQASEFVASARSTSRRPQVVNVEIRDSSDRITGYANVLIPPGTSTFDIYRIQKSPEGKQLARQIARQARRNSPPYDVDEITDPVTGRKIARKRVSKDAGSPAGEQRIARVRVLSQPGKRRYVGRFTAPKR